MSGVVSRTNKRKNPVFKLFANFLCLKNFCRYGTTQLRTLIEHTISINIQIMPRNNYVCSTNFIPVSVLVSGQYQHFLVVSEFVKYVAQVPIPLLC